MSAHLRISLSSLIVVLLCLLTSCSNRLAPWQDLLVGTPAMTTAAPRGREVQVTYLGTNGYLIRSRHSTIVIDPYFSRIGMRDVVLNAPVNPDEAVTASATTLASFPRTVDAWLVTHAHFDHLFDVPPLQKKYGGKIVTSPTGAFLSEASGVPPHGILSSKPGAVHRFGSARVRVLTALHDKALGMVPYPGRIDARLAGPADRAKEWKLGIPLAFLIELEGKRIYIESGGLKGSPPPVTAVDLAIVGTATPSSQARYSEAIRALNPRHVLPSHQDNFFLPVENGFHFSTLANFPKIKATHEVEELPGEIILMDYFQTWTLE